MSDFDYGGEIASPVSLFKNPTVGARTARLWGLLRIGTFAATFTKGNVKEDKAPAPYALAIFQLLGKADKLEDGSPMFFVKDVPLKRGDKSFLHKSFIPAMGGMAKHKGFATMGGQLVNISLKGSKELNEDQTPKYVNFASISEIPEEMVEMLEGNPAMAALPDAPGFLMEGELTEAALMKLNPVREFAEMVMLTEEFKAGTHPSQDLIQSMFDKDKERYTRKAKKEAGEDGTDDDSAPTTSAPAGKVEALDEEEAFDA